MNKIFALSHEMNHICKQNIGTQSLTKKLCFKKSPYVNVHETFYKGINIS